MLTILGAIISGARHNAIRAISPATTKMLLKTVRDSETSQEIHIAAIYCSAKSIQVLHETPECERQLDITLVIQQYQQILTSLSEKDTANLATLIEGVAMLTRVLQVRSEIWYRIS